MTGCQRTIRFALCGAWFFVAAASAQPADEEPDISGVWQAYASVAEPGTGQREALSEEGAARVDAFYDQYGDDMPEPGWYCVPPGLPATMISMVSYPLEIIQSPGRITMIHELDMQVRRIFMDGRGFPPDNYWTTRMGYSNGRWEGETLVIETRYLSEYLTRSWPRTASTEVVERIWRAQRDEVDVVRNGFPEENDSNELLVIELTVTDDTLYREPQVITMYYQRISDAEFLEYDCTTGLWNAALDAALD